MKLNLDSKTKIKVIYEDGMPVQLDNDRFTIYHKFKATACITSPPSTLSKHISILPEWKRTLIGKTTKKKHQDQL